MSENSVRRPIIAAALPGLSAVATFINYSHMKNESKRCENPCQIGERLGLTSNPAWKVHFYGTSQGGLRVESSHQLLRGKIR